MHLSEEVRTCRPRALLQFKPGIIMSDYLSPGKGLVNALAVALNTLWRNSGLSNSDVDQFQTIYKNIKGFLRKSSFVRLDMQSAKEVMGISPSLSERSA